MDTTVHFNNSTHVAQLTGAILLYIEKAGRQGYIDREQRMNATTATIHSVVDNVILPGRAITRADLETLSQDLGRKQERAVAFLPENVLALTDKIMAWWMPARVDRIWFHPAVPKDENAGLKAISGEKVHHPPLLFVATADNRRDVDVFALKENKRPTPETKLYKAPYWNISDMGSLCVGTGTRMPRELVPSLIPKYEESFFGSNFAHCNYNKTYTRFPGGHNALWKKMMVHKRPLKPDQMAARHAPHLVESPVKNVTALLAI